MTANEMETHLRDLLNSVSEFDFEELEDIGLSAEAFAMMEVRTFDEAGILSINPGVILELSDGSEFQLHIAKRG